MPSQFTTFLAVPDHYSTSSQGSMLHLSSDFMVDLLRCTVSISESLRFHEGLKTLFDQLHAANHLPDGDLTRREICGLMAFELTYATYRYCHAGSSECPDFPGVFDYEVPGLLINRYYEVARKLPFGSLPNQHWIRGASAQIIQKWFNPDPVWEASFTGHSVPLTASAPDFPTFIAHLKSTGVDLKQLAGVRQIPDGTD